jgi:hypothetical protein
MDFTINLDGLDFGNFDITDFASSLDFNLEDDVLNASLSGKSATPYYSDYEYSNAPLQEQEWFKPKYKNILKGFFEGQDQFIGAASTADNARMALWGDAQKALNSGADPDKVFNALRAAGNKSEAKLIEENLTNKRKLAGKKVGSTGQFESLVVDSARENLNTFNSNLSSTLQSNPDSFNSQFDALPTNGKLSFLHHQYKQGDLPKDKYEEAYIATVNSAYDPNVRNTPVFVEVEGKVYLNPSPWKTNKTADELLEPDFYNVDEWSPAGGSENAIGVRVTGERTDDFDASGFKKFLQDFSVFRAPLALVTAGASEAFISAAAGLSGETLKTSDWLNLASLGLNQIANTTGTTAAEAEATARATVDEAITNGTVTTAAEAQALYESTLGSIDVAGTLLGVDLTDFATDTGALSSGGSAIADAVSALEAAAEGEGAGVVLNLLEDTVDSLEDVDEDTTPELEIINEIINTIITDDEDEEVIATPPPQVETEQELPDAPEAEQEPIVADPIEEVITQPTLPEVVEEVEEVEEVEAGGGGEPAPEPTAPTEPTEPTAPTEQEGESDTGGIFEGIDQDVEDYDRYDDEDEFKIENPDGWLGGSFDDIDVNNDGVISNQEMYDWEHSASNTEEEDSTVIDIIGDITEDTVDPVIPLLIPHSLLL